MSDVNPGEVGRVDHQLRHDAFMDGPYIIERIEVVAVCDTREEAVEWMRSRPKPDDVPDYDGGMDAPDGF